MKDFYIHLSSDESLKYFPQNSASQFSVYFPEVLDLTGIWMCAMVEVSMPASSTGDLYVACDIVEGVLTSTGKFPILRRLFKKAKYMEFINRQYVRVTRIDLQSLSIKVIDTDGSPITFTSGRTRCTLHIKKVS